MVAACTETTVPEDEPKPDVEQPDGDPASPDASTTRPGRDAGADATARDAGADVDTDAETPDAADAGCELGELRTEPCGLCGEKTASCNESGTWRPFGACREPDDACEPQAREDGLPCGQCGATSRTCNDSCQWVVEACVEGDAGCGGPAGALILPTTLGASAEDVFELEERRMLRLVSGGPPCNVSGPPFNTESSYTYVRVYNPGHAAVRAELRLGRAPDEDQVEVLIAAYASLPDADAASRAACLTGAAANCFDELDYLSCLIDDDAPRVAAGASIWVYVGNYRSDDPAAPFLLRATTLAVE